jgi:hypothetical protein
VTCAGPVLLIGFNRPEPLEQTFARVREVRPPRLYLAVDGARPGRGEEARVAQVQAFATQVDWPCEVKTLFQPANLGCKRGVSAAIDWFFENEERGIILEDDCVPDASFFPFCDELLERYAADTSVAQICGSNFVGPPADGASYFGSHYADIWGWATWRRAWKARDAEMAGWPAWRDADGLAKMPGSSPGFVEYWTKIFDACWRGEIDTWDYQWMFSCWHDGKISIQPAPMLVRNVGFGADATHTGSDVPSYVVPTGALSFPLTHPTTLIPDPRRERAMAQRRYLIDWSTELRVRAERVPFVGAALVGLGRRVAGR